MSDEKPSAEGSMSSAGHFKSGVSTKPSIRAHQEAVRNKALQRRRKVETRDTCYNRIDDI